jgi:hypothetical protein
VSVEAVIVIAGIVAMIYLVARIGDSISDAGDRIDKRLASIEKFASKNRRDDHSLLSAHWPATIEKKSGKRKNITLR